MSKRSAYDLIGDLLGAISGPYGLIWKLAGKSSRMDAILDERRRNFVIPADLHQELTEILAEKWGLSPKRFKPSARIVSDLRVPPGDVYSTTEWLERYYFARIDMDDMEVNLSVSDYLTHLSHSIRAAHPKAMDHLSFRWQTIARLVASSFDQGPNPRDGIYACVRARTGDDVHQLPL